MPFGCVVSLVIKADEAVSEQAIRDGIAQFDFGMGRDGCGKRECLPI